MVSFYTASTIDDGKPCSLAELEQLLREKKEKAEAGKEPELQIFANKTVPYQNLYNVLDSVTKAGLSRSLQAKFERSGP